MENLRTLFKQALSNIINDHEYEIILDRPKSWKNGDVTFPCFNLAKKYKQSPQQVASYLASKISINDAEILAVGPYLNLKLHPLRRAQIIIKTIMSSNPYGSDKNNGKTIIIEYSSPNIAKLFTIGHLRSTMIGHSLVQINRYLGFNVIGINHLGDWGTQFGTLLAAYKKWAERDNPKLDKNFSWSIDEDSNKCNSPLYRLFQLYVRFHTTECINTELHNEAKKWFTLLENGNKEATELWLWFRNISVAEFMRIYKRLGVSFDYIDMGEAFYQDKLKSVLELLDRKNLLDKGEGGSLIIDLNDVNIKTPCLVRKSDGSSIYATRDIAAAIFRRSNWNFFQCLYVVGSDQLLHFKQLFAVMEKVDSWYKGRMIHVPFGMISLPDGKMSTRKGNVIFLEDVLDEAVSRIKTIIETKNTKLVNKDHVSEILGVGAVIFFNALNDRSRSIKFSWDHVIAIDGDTGPYVQYAHARIISLLRKAGTDWIKKATPIVNDNVSTNKAALFYPDIEVVDNLFGLEDDAAQNLLFELANMYYAYRDMQRENMGTSVARQLINIAKAFSSFYKNCPILTNNNIEQICYSRLTLCVATARVLRQGLYILGIQAPEEM